MVCAVRKDHVHVVHLQTFEAFPRALDDAVMTGGDTVGGLQHRRRLEGVLTAS